MFTLVFIRPASLARSAGALIYLRAGPGVAALQLAEVTLEAAVHGAGSCPQLRTSHQTSGAVFPFPY